MVDFPSQDAFFPSGAGNVGPVRTGQRAFWSAVRQLPGARAAAALTIASGAVTPTQGVHVIDTESEAAADDLATIGQDNLPDGSLIILMSADAGRVVTVKDSAGGAGQILLADDEDLALAHPSMRLCLRRDGTTWVEEWRSYGNQAAAARAKMGLGTAAVADSDDFEPADAAIVKADEDKALAAGYSQAPTALGSLDAMTADTLTLADTTGNNRFDLTVDVDGEIDAAGLPRPIEITITNSGARSLTISGATQTANSADFDGTAGAVNIILFRKDSAGNVDYTIDQRGA